MRPRAVAAVIGIVVVAVVAVGLVSARPPQPTEADSVDPSPADHISAAHDIAETRTRAEVKHGVMDVLLSERDAPEKRARVVDWRRDEIFASSERIYAEHHRLAERYNEGEISAERYAFHVGVLSVRADILDESLSRTEAAVPNNTTVRERRWQSSGQLHVLANPHMETVWRSMLAENRSVSIVDEGGVPRFVTTTDDGKMLNLQVRPPVVSPFYPDKNSELHRKAEKALADSSWLLIDMRVDIDRGVYVFEYVRAGEMNGRAKTVVEVTTGRVVKSVEVEGEPVNESVAGNGNRVAIVPVSGELMRGEAVDLMVLQDGEPANASISVNGTHVGNVSAKSQMQVRLPYNTTSVTAEVGNTTERLRFNWGASVNDSDENRTETKSDEDTDCDDIEDEKLAVVCRNR